MKGNCWLCSDGEEVPVRVDSGDVLLVSQRPIVFASDLTVAPIDGTTLYAGNPNQIATLKREIGVAPTHYRTSARSIEQATK